eukprot:5099353-Amphidinium_carterae.1
MVRVWLLRWMLVRESHWKWLAHVQKCESRFNPKLYPTPVLSAGYPSRHNGNIQHFPPAHCSATQSRK